MPDPAGLLEVWRHEAPRTIRVVSSFEDADLGYRPAPGHRSVGETCEYLASSYELTERWLAADTPSPVVEPRHVTTVVEAIDRLTEAQAALFDALDRLPAERFFDVIAPFGVPEHRGVMALGMFKHELHYRGELYALARVCRREPPDLYAPARVPPAHA
jgi:uncharacterized damage-inducible protein DinB